MELTVEQALALAPDASSASAGRKLARPGDWRNLGRNEVALWGECQGSALYQTRVDLRDYATRCSCPSRKFPCKHALGLLVLAAATPDLVPSAGAPEWVESWLIQREKRAARTDGDTETKPATTTKTPPRQREDRRLARVQAGVDALNLWLDDLIRNGLAQVGMQPARFWEQQAARLVDAQASGLASRVRRLAAIPNASADWPSRLLDELGKLALLTHAFGRIDELDPALRDDVRTATGWTIERDEVIERGETVTDDWLVIGQRVVAEERLRAQRTWLLGTRSGRSALVLQFAHGTAPFTEAFAPGTRFGADVAFFPSALPLRAIVRERHGSPVAIRQDDACELGGSIDAVLASWAAALARQPWIERIPVVLRSVVPVIEEAGDWVVRDDAGRALALEGAPHWSLLAHSGGRPLDLTAEWDGQALAPLGVFVAGAWQSLPEAG
ncbi:MAG TPA: SWIM zinc finger family protein [Thermomicrobiales bacterium]|nr:SWIM zinc finger family protein [Thermomicrobiales bacterium]